VITGARNLTCVMDGRELASTITDALKDKIEKLDFVPRLETVLIGDDVASKIYVNVKQKKCRELGIENNITFFDTREQEPSIIAFLQDLSNDREVDGILLQLPLPPKFSAHRLLQCIVPAKDVDGLTYENAGKLIHGNPSAVIPCTAAGIIALCRKYNLQLAGRNVCVIGRSNLVGRPVARLFEKYNATVTLCHSGTTNLEEMTERADIIVVATGQPGLITRDMISKGVAIIDVGINRVGHGLVGDVDYPRVKNVCSYITPVPGGVGPMTVASLMNNLYTLAIKRRTLGKRESSPKPVISV